MNTEALKTLTTWHAVQSNADSVTLISPSSFGDDGACISFTVIFRKGSFALTDFAEHTYLAESLGAKITKDRLLKLNETTGVHYAHFTEQGEITATGTEELLQFALFDALKLALSLSFKMDQWLPKLREQKFRDDVELALRRNIPDKKIKTDIKVVGMTGHPINIPLAVETDKKLIYIEPIAVPDGRIDWQRIYAAHGKFTDIKHSDDINKRLTIIEAGKTSEIGAAETLLAEVSSIRRYNSPDDLTLRNIAA